MKLVFLLECSLWHEKDFVWEQIHGILSVAGWGFLLPIGAMAARYLRTPPFEQKRWFLVHVPIQLAGYSIGTAAWGIGLSLATNSRHPKAFFSHKIIGILIFCLATLQVSLLHLLSTSFILIHTITKFKRAIFMPYSWYGITCILHCKYFLTDNGVMAKTE